MPLTPDPELLTTEPTATAGAQAKPGVGSKEVASVHQGMSQTGESLGVCLVGTNSWSGSDALQGFRSPFTLVTKGQFGDEQVIIQILPSTHLC